MAVHSKAEILPTHTPSLFRTAVGRAAELLRAGELVALPTETVYGLAANAFDPDAVAKIFRIKGRPANNPIIVHVSSNAMAKRCVEEWSAIADKLSAAFWPGPLTVVLKRSARIPDNVTAQGSTVGVRWPSHPFIQAVIRECDFPLAAPSANLSNSISPTNAEHVCKGLGDKIKLIVDGGQSQVGIESTVLDLTAKPARLLRPGMIHEESLLSVLGQITLGFGDSEEILKSPGMLRKHYSPKAKVVVLAWKNEEDLKLKIENLRASNPNAGWDLARTHVIAHSRIPLSPDFARVAVIPHDAEAFARAIYAELHHCDEEGAKLIVIEKLSSAREWRAISDRLSRAAAD